jgi:hypothetical protein
LSGNVAGIRSAYAELASLLSELDDHIDAYMPSPATTAFLEHLLERSRRSA